MDQAVPVLASYNWKKRLARLRARREEPVAESTSRRLVEIRVPYDGEGVSQIARHEVERVLDEIDKLRHQLAVSAESRPLTRQQAAATLQEMSKTANSLALLLMDEQYCRQNGWVES